MGLYIKGMKMPHDCDECKLCAFIPVGDYSFYRKCMPLNRNAEITVRRKDCPLVELPPHGDLIDRGAFRAEMDKHYPFDHGTQRKHGEADAAKSTIITMLANSPVIVPEEREAAT